METEDWMLAMAERSLDVADPVTAQTGIQASISAVWSVIAAPGGLESFHPFCAANTVVKWPGADAEDLVTYYSGLKYRRRFRQWYDHEGYDLELGVGDRVSAYVQWRLRTSGPTSRLTIRVYPLLISIYSPAKKAAFLERQFGPLLRHYLDCVVAGARHRVETGLPVREDQFGRNEIYSARGDG